MRRWSSQILPTGQFVRAVALLTGGTALGQAVVVLASPILTRLYLPEDFGVLAVYVSMLAILVTVASLHYQMAIVLPEQDETAANLLVLSLVLVLGISLLSVFGVWLLADQIARWTNTPALRTYLWLLPLGLLGGGGYQVLSHWAIRRRAFTFLARTRLSQGLAQVLTQVGLGFLKLGPAGLLLGDVVGRTGGSGTLATLTWRQDREVIKQVSLKGVRSVAGRYRRFPLISSGSGLLNSASLHLPALLLATFYGPQVAGWFALAQRVIVIPVALLGTSVAHVFRGESARVALRGDEQLSALFWRTSVGQLIIGLLFVAFVALPAPISFPILFGSEWGESGAYVQVLSLMFLLQFVYTPVSETTTVVERQDLYLLQEIVRVVLLGGAFSLAVGLEREPLTAVAFLGVANSASYAFGIALAWYSIRNRRIFGDTSS